jgi:prepilin-type N-terminal cleavage/methylation domain-containing protein
MKKTSGFTILEMVSVVTIVAILSAILMPVFARAKMEAKVTSAGQRLRQLHLQLMLYRADQEQAADTGYPWEMGLPWTVRFTTDDKGNLVPIQPSVSDKNSVDFEIFQKLVVEPEKRSPCGFHQELVPFCFGWDYLATRWFFWKPDSEKYGDRQVVFTDYNCNAQGTDFFNQFATKRALGITMGGALIDRTKSDQQIFTQEFYL